MENSNNNMKHIYSKSLIFLFLLFFSGLFFVSAQTNSNKELLRFCADPDWMPYEAIRDGKHVGIASDYLAIVKKHSNYNFELLKTSSWEQSIEMLKSGKCQLTFMLNQTEDRNQYLKFSNVYFRTPNVLVSKREQPFLQDISHIGDRKLAVVKNYRIVEYIDKYHPGINKLLVANEDEGMRAIADGKADVYVGSMLSLNARVQQYGYGYLKIAGWGGPEDQLRVGVIHDMAHILDDINNAFDQISERERIEIFSRWNNTRIINETDYSDFYKAMLFLGAVILFFIFRQVQLNKFNHTLSDNNDTLEKLHKKLEIANSELQNLSFKDSLTQLYNRRYFSRFIHDELKSLKRTQQNSCLMLVDIDFFKQVNDNYGHAIGDDVLAEMARVFKSIMREADLAARWGGEEFIFLLPDTTSADAKNLAGRLLDKVRENEFAAAGQLTVSIGLSQYQDNETFESWFDRTDTALYEAKAQGRDQFVLA